MTCHDTVDALVGELPVNVNDAVGEVLSIVYACPFKVFESANPGDAVAPGWPALPAGVFGIMLVSATNTVTVRLCNLSGLGVDPPSATYRATIVRNY